MGMSPVLLIPRSGLRALKAQKSRTLVASAKTSFVAASSAETNLGTSDALLFFAASRATTGNQAIMAKYQDANNYWRLEFTAAHKLHFIAVVSGVTKIEITSTTAYSTTGVWIFGCVAIDRSAAAGCKIYVNRLDDTAGVSTTSTDTIDNTGSFYVGQMGVWPWALLDAAIATFAIGKPTDASAVAASAASAHYYGGLGRVHAAFTPAILAAYGIVTYWDCGETDETSGLTDACGAVNLTRTPIQLLTNETFGMRYGLTWRDFRALDQVHFECADDDALDLGPGDFILSVHGKRASTGNQVLVSKYEDANNYWKLEIVATTHLAHFIAVAGGVTIIDVLGTTALSSTTTKYHLAVVCDRDSTDNTKLYVNGVDDTAATPTISATSISNAGKLYVAAFGTSGPTLYWDGRLAQLGISKPYPDVYLMGDSLMAAGGAYIQAVVAAHMTNCGVGGNTTTQMAARFTADVITPGDGEYVMVWGGINDVGTDVAAVDIETNLQAMYSAAKAAGMTVIAATISPRSGLTAGQQTVMDAVNTWILNTATDVDYRLDLHVLLEDPANPNLLLPAYDADGVHLTAAGYTAVAAYVAAQVAFLTGRFPSTTITDAYVAALYNGGWGRYYNEFDVAGHLQQIRPTAFYDMLDDSRMAIADLAGENDLAAVCAEMITNGDFATGDLTGWTNSGLTTFEYSAGELHVVSDGDPQYQEGGRVPLHLAPGRSYTASVKHTRVSGSALYAAITPAIGGTSGNVGFTSLLNATGTTTQTFVCTDTDADNWFNLVGYAGYAAEWLIDNVSVKANGAPVISDPTPFYGWTTSTPVGDSQVSQETINIQAGDLACRLSENAAGDAASVAQNILTVGQEYAYSIQSLGSAAGKTYTVYVGTATAEKTADSGAFGAETGTLTCAGNTTFKIETLSCASASIYLGACSVLATKVASTNGPGA